MSGLDEATHEEAEKGWKINSSVVHKDFHNKVVEVLESRVKESERTKDKAIVSLKDMTDIVFEQQSKIEKAEKIILKVIDFSKPSEKFTMRNLAIEYQRKYLRTGL